MKEEEKEGAFGRPHLQVKHAGLRGRGNGFAFADFIEGVDLGMEM